MEMKHTRRKRTDERTSGVEFMPTMETHPDAFAQGPYLLRTTGTVWAYGQTTAARACRWLDASSVMGKATMIVRATVSPGWILVSGVSAGCAPVFSVGKAWK